MPKKTFIPNKLLPWIEARKKYHLSHAQIQMARELGLNPKKFGKKANHKQEPWKAPLPQYIEYLYEKKFKKKLPAEVMSIEKKAAKEKNKKAERKKQKRLKEVQESHAEEIKGTDAPFIEEE